MKHFENCETHADSNGSKILNDYIYYICNVLSVLRDLELGSAFKSLKEPSQTALYGSIMFNHYLRNLSSCHEISKYLKIGFHITREDRHRDPKRKTTGIDKEDVWPSTMFFLVPPVASCIKGYSNNM